MALVRLYRNTPCDPPPHDESSFLQTPTHAGELWHASEVRGVCAQPSFFSGTAGHDNLGFVSNDVLNVSRRCSLSAFMRLCR